MSVCILGSINLDLVTTVDALPQPGQSVAALAYAEHAGGKGANQAVAAARAGAAVRLVGAVGRDEAGPRLVGRLAQLGVAVEAVAVLGDEPTGRAHIVVDQAGENVIVVVGGANLAVDAALAARAADHHPKVILAQLECPVSAVEAAFAAAPQAIKMLNAAPADRAARPLLAKADLVIVNETELAEFAGLEAKLDPADAEAVTAAARGLLTRPGQWVLVTLGAAGAVAVSRDQAMARPACRAPAVVDTTGAGDCFCGALAARLAEDATLETAMAFAAAAAALSVSRSGAAESMPARAEIEALLERAQAAG